MTAVALPIAGAGNTALRLLPHPGYSLILSEVAKGRTVRSAVRRLRRRGIRTPSVSRFFEWGIQTPERYELFTRAMETRTEIQVDELEDIIDGAFVDPDGNRITDPALLSQYLKAAETKMRIRQWAAAKRMPRKYGDKLNVEHSGALSVEIVTGIPEIPAAKESRITYTLGDDSALSEPAMSTTASASSRIVCDSMAMLD